MTVGSQEKHNKEVKTRENKQKIKVTELSPNISIITLNVNGLKTANKRLAERYKQRNRLNKIKKFILKKRYKSNLMRKDSFFNK